MSSGRINTFPYPTPSFSSPPMPPDLCRLLALLHNLVRSKGELCVPASSEKLLAFEKTPVDREVAHVPLLRSVAGYHGIEYACPSMSS